MSPDRRQFLWTMGSAAALLSLQQQTQVFWAPATESDPGWEPGIEEWLPSSCLICPARCGIRGRVVDGKLVRITGNRMHPMSRGGLCPRGVAGAQMLYHPDRVTSPLVREGPRDQGSWRAVSLEEALNRVSERLLALRADGRPERLAAITGYCTGTVRDLWLQFLRAFGSPNLFAEDHSDGTEAISGLMHGTYRRPSYDLENATLVVSFGAPLFESWWSPLQSYVGFGLGDGAGDRGARFVQVDTRFSRTAAHADEWVGVRPSTHAVLALGMAYVMIRDSLVNSDFIGENVSGFEDYMDAQGRAREGYRSIVLRQYRTEEVSRLTGVSVERISSLARSFAQGAASVAICGHDVMASPHGLLAGLAVHSLNILVGNLNRPGGIVFGTEPPLQPLVPVRLDGTATDGSNRDPVGGPSPEFGNTGRVDRFAETVANSATSPVDVLLIYEADPLATTARPGEWRDALNKIPFVVSFSPFLDDTTSLADVVLPDLLPYERWQDAPTPMTYPHAAWGVVQPLVDPQEGGMHTGDVLLGLARILGGTVQDSLPYDSFQSLLRTRARGLFEAGRGSTFAGDFERADHRRMEERGWWLPAEEDFDGFWSRLVERGGWIGYHQGWRDRAPRGAPPPRRIDLFPPALERWLDAEGEGRRPYASIAPGAPPSDPDFPLRLIPYRVSTLASRSMGLEPWLAEQPGILPDVQWTPWVLVTPASVDEIGLQEDTMVWIVSARGRYRARLKTSVGVAPGTVCAPYGLRHPGGDPANPLVLLDGDRDPLTGLLSWHTTFVRLEQA